ncbi:MAG: hypothetical protein V4694_05900 [Pseudomonadota bacterium]
MNASIILEELNNFDKIRHFISLLENDFISNQAFLSKLKLAKNSTDKALMQLTFDLNKKLKNSQIVIAKKTTIADDITDALNQLKTFDFPVLTQALSNLITFAQSYENNSELVLSNDEIALKNLKERVFLIMAERFE